MWGISANASTPITVPSSRRTPVSRSSVTSSALIRVSIDGDAAGFELLCLFVGEWRGVREVGDVVAQLTEEQRLVHRPWSVGEHADPLITHLPSVAVGTVQDVATPALPKTGDVG